LSGASEDKFKIKVTEHYALEYQALGHVEKLKPECTSTLAGYEIDFKL
jgi:hypothetical protein